MNGNPRKVTILKMKVSLERMSLNVTYLLHNESKYAILSQNSLHFHDLRIFVTNFCHSDVCTFAFRVWMIVNET